jgi:methionyl-tRNA formyltransferase
MRIVFFGSGAFGLPSLQHLAQHHTLLTVVSQPDKPAGRGSQLTPTPIAEWAAKSLTHVPLIRPTTVNEPSVRDALRALEADAWVVIAFGQKLGRALLDGKFAVNLHASLLPRWRGAAPIHAAILAGDTTTGNSVITLADKMDAGLVLGQSHRDIAPDITTGQLHDQLANDGPALLDQVLTQHATSSLTPQVQDESRITLAGKLGRADAYVDFAQTSEQCRCRINGLSPWPGVSVQFRGTALKLLRATSGPSIAIDAPPGTVIDASRGHIACAGRTTLELIEVQPAGKRAMPWRDFANGQRVRAMSPLDQSEADRLIGGGATAC